VGRVSYGMVHLDEAEASHWPSAAWRKHPYFPLFAAAVIAFVMLVAGCKRAENVPDAKSRGTADSVTIDMSVYGGAALIYIALAKRLFEDEGLKITVQTHSTGKESLDAVLSGGADVATVAELPITLAILEGRPVAIVATLASGESDYGVVGRSDKGIAGPASLKGKRVAVTLGTSSDFFLDALLVRHRLSRADVRLINRKPDEMADTLEKGEADAASTWEPYLSSARKRLGSNSTVVGNEGIYESTFNLATTRDFVGQRSETVKKLLRALIRAEQLYIDDRPTAEKIVAEWLKSDAPEAAQFLSKHRLGLSLDQSLLVMMEDEARWAVRNKLVESKATPNFLNNIDIDALLAVEARAVTVIH